MTIAVIASLYLLSNLGVEGEENIIVLSVGVTGIVSIGFAALVNFVMLIKTRNEHQRNSTSSTELPPTQRSDRGFSASDIEENAIALALV